MALADGTNRCAPQASSGSPCGNIVDKQFHRLRQKLKNGFATDLIRTVPGAGHTLDVPAQSPT
jgi:DNA-binding response OmpR family regulator